MGRPPKNPEDRKTYQLHVPLTDAQHSLIKQAVELGDDDKAEWARAVLLDAAKRSIAKSAKGKPN
jgi:hypothetical protein